MNNEEQTPFDDGTRVVNKRQRLYLGYTIAILLYLTIINLCDEYWDWVSIESFSISMLVSILLVVGLAFFIKMESKAADYFKSKSGVKAKVLRGISSYIILVGGKFLLMGVIAVLFGDLVKFSGPLHGAVAFIGLVTAVLVADGIVKKIYTSLGSPVKD